MVSRKRKIPTTSGRESTKKDDRSETERLKEQLARALADYDNLRKRVEREREEYGTYAKLTLMARFLPVFDMLEGAQVHLKDSGLAITIEEFAKVLKEEGIEKIEVAPGDTFDEELHEAVEVVDLPAGKKGKKAAGPGASSPEGEIDEIILTGWRLVDGPIIRPAKVKVYKQSL
ncbi:nucleotide exchange factor GrpE [Patescibacteria group bacterium]|nr:nucleotide exchange factor GrpE [Patescibacteria group bacterium]